MQNFRWMWVLLIALALVVTAPAFNVSVANAQLDYDDDGDDYDDGDGDEYGDEDEDVGRWIKVTVKASTKSGAIARVWIDAMMKVLKGEIKGGDYTANKEKIEKYVKSNWKEYADDDNIRIRKRWNRRTRSMTAEVRFDADQLVKDVKDRVVKAKQKMTGMKVALFPTSDAFQKAGQGGKWKLEKLFDTIQHQLSVDMRIYNMIHMDQLMTTEARALGLSATSSPEDFEMALFNRCQVKVGLSVETERKFDPLAKQNKWFATVFCAGLLTTTGQELWHMSFTSESGEAAGVAAVAEDIIGAEEAQKRAIDAMCTFVAKYIKYRVSTSDIILPESHYILSFTSFKPNEREKIEEAISDLGSETLRVIATHSAGAGQFEMEVDWLMTEDSQHDVKRAIKEACEGAEVAVVCYKEAPGKLYFQPQKESGPNFDGF